MEDILFRASLAATLLAITTGPLGCFVVWQRMAYFGDTLAHASLLGIALGLSLSLPLPLAIVLVAISLALSLSLLQQSSRVPLDSLLGILAHGSLALGVIVLGMTGRGNIDWMSLLFGDLLTLDNMDLLWMAGIALLVLTLLRRYWSELVLITLDAELAAVEGVADKKLQRLLLVMVALTVAAAVQVVGVLLVSAMLIIPAATARNLASSPLQMMRLAALFGALAAYLGIGLSFAVDVSTGPAIVLLAFLLFLCSLLFNRQT